MSKERPRKRQSKPFAFLMDRWALIGIAVVLVALIGVGGAYAVSSTRETPDYTSSYVPAEPEQYDYLRVAIMGDSFTRGVGASDGVGYATTIGQQLCWNTQIDGQSSTGYANPGPAGSKPYTDRAASVAESQAPLIIVQGSTNDAGRPGIEQAATATFETLKRESPQSKIVAVGPTAPPSVDRVQVMADRDAVRSAAARAGVTFIDPIALGWLADPTLYGPDELHPTREGHNLMAESLRAELEKVGLPRLNTCDPV